MYAILRRQGPRKFFDPEYQRKARYGAGGINRIDRMYSK